LITAWCPDLGALNSCVLRLPHPTRLWSVIRPGPWTLPRIARYLGSPQVSSRTLYRRVRHVAVWRRPKLTARGDPDHDQAVAGIVARLLELPRRAVVLAKDETHLNLLPHVRASWTPRGARPRIPLRARTGR
jgi:hypothetical protein